MWLVLTGTFFLMHLAPGVPLALLGTERISAETKAELVRLYGLDQPLPKQYLQWLSSVARGRWGVSFVAKRPALDVVLDRLPASLLLVLSGVFLEHLIGLWIGIAAARRAGGPFDRYSRFVSLVFHSIPSYVLGIFAIEIFAMRFGLLPAQHLMSEGFHQLSALDQALDVLRHLTLPALTLALVRFGAVARFMRNGMLDILSQDYIRTARSLGLSERRVLWLHALPNCVGPLVQRLGTSLPLLFSGTVVLEVVFSWPGIGSTFFGSILQRDYPVILLITAMSAFGVILGSTLADVVHAWIDPRVREHYG